MNNNVILYYKFVTEMGFYMIDITRLLLIWHYYFNTGTEYPGKTHIFKSYIPKPFQKKGKEALDLL